MRLIDARHRWFSSSRNAEMNVPAWPIPIHHTKSVMPYAQATGMLLPHVPIPRLTVMAIATRKSTASAPVTRKSHRHV